MTLLLNDAIVFLICQTLKRWAEPFLVLRAALYLDEMGEEMKNRFNSGVSSEGSFHDPTGLDIIRLPLAEIVEWLLVTSGMKAA